MSESDRELLELAAKAAGHGGAEWGADYQENGPFGDSFKEGLIVNGAAWNPLTDDGDALRLAAKKRFTVKIADHEVEVFDEASGECLVSISMHHPTDEEIQHNVRLAITTAAAEITRRELASRTAES